MGTTIGPGLVKHACKVLFLSIVVTGFVIIQLNLLIRLRLQNPKCLNLDSLN